MFGKVYFIEFEIIIEELPIGLTPKESMKKVSKKANEDSSEDERFNDQST
jgi:hypothetical protein